MPILRHQDDVLTQTQSDDESKSQKCNGMYSKGSWGGSVDPFILTKIEKPANLANKDALASFVIFEWRDEPLIGVKKAETATVIHSTGGLPVCRIELIM